MQLELFQDTGEGCSFVARPVSQILDGLHAPLRTLCEEDFTLPACPDCGSSVDCDRAASSVYKCTSGCAPGMRKVCDRCGRMNCPSLDCFDGATYEPVHDELRLGKQALAVFELMRDGNWRTLREITVAIGGGSEAGVSARLRDFRKKKFGGHVVNRRRRGEEALGVFEYQVICK